MPEREFSVWAPRAARVELELDGRRLAMAGPTNGWHQVALDCAPRARYGFVLDGAGPFADPRSRSQPDGPLGLSRLDHPGDFNWTDQLWAGVPLEDLLVYELHIGTFSAAGTFEGAIPHLDHLVDLGVTAIEIMPVAAFAGARGWGYDGVNLFAPHPHYGGPSGLRELVDACHARGLGVILDVVYNHVGPEGNHLPRFGPYMHEGDPTVWGPGFNLDGPDSGPVRQFVLDNASMWITDYHLDGLRLDAVHAIRDDSRVNILQELASTVRGLEATAGRPLHLIAESDLNDARLVRDPARGGFGLDAQWSDDFHHSLHALLTGERDGYYADFGRPEQLLKALNSPFVYDGVMSPSRGRRHGFPVGDVADPRFIIYTQNHDQVGNRARGDRLCHLVSADAVRWAAAAMLLTRFTPLIFMGEEWGASTPFCFFSDHQDPQIAGATSQGRKREFAAFGWDPDSIPDPQDRRTFAASKLDWSELERAPHHETLEFYRRLIRERRDSGPVISNATLEQGTIGWRRRGLSVELDLGSLQLRLSTPSRGPSRP